MESQNLVNFNKFYRTNRNLAVLVQNNSQKEPDLLGFTQKSANSSKGISRQSQSSPTQFWSHISWFSMHFLHSRHTHCVIQMCWEDCNQFDALLGWWWWWWRWRQWLRKRRGRGRGGGGGGKGRGEEEESKKQRCHQVEQSWGWETAEMAVNTRLKLTTPHFHLPPPLPHRSC